MVADPKEKPRPTTRPTHSSTEIDRIARNEAGARLIAKVLRDLLNSRKFNDSGLLRDALEERCKHLRMSFTRQQVERALELVGSNTQLLAANQVVGRKPARHVAAPEPTVNAPEAKSILDRLGVDVSGGRVRRGSGRSRLVPM